MLLVGDQAVAEEQAELDQAVTDGARSAMIGWWNEHLGRGTPVELADLLHRSVRCTDDLGEPAGGRWNGHPDDQAKMEVRTETPSERIADSFRVAWSTSRFLLWQDALDAPARGPSVQVTPPGFLVEHGGEKGHERFGGSFTQPCSDGRDPGHLHLHHLTRALVSRPASFFGGQHGRPGGCVREPCQFADDIRRECRLLRDRSSWDRAGVLRGTRAVRHDFAGRRLAGRRLTWPSVDERLQGVPNAPVSTTAVWAADLGFYVVVPAANVALWLQATRSTPDPS